MRDAVLEKDLDELLPLQQVVVKLQAAEMRKFQREGLADVSRIKIALTTRARR